MKAIERTQSVPTLASLTDTVTLQNQLAFLHNWRQQELERAQLTKGPVRASSLAQLRWLEKEISRNNRFLANRGLIA